MSRKIMPNSTSNDIGTPYLSSKDKVIQYLQNSTRSSNINAAKTTISNNNFDPFNRQRRTYTFTDNVFYVKDTSTNNDLDQYDQRMRSCSENYSATSQVDQLSRCNISIGSSLSDPGGHRSILSSNTSSSGICSTFSDVSHEENTSRSSEDLDFNLGFDQNSNIDEIEVGDTDESGQNEGENQRISNKSSDTATLLDFGELNLDARISELEGLLHKSSSSTSINSNGELNTDDLVTNNQTKTKKKTQRASFLHDSTFTLCAQDRFSAFTENDDNDDDDDDDDNTSNTIGKRSNSLGIPIINRPSVLLDKPPKKAVRFADMMGLDLESIRYMTPPDQSANILIQECMRMKLEQLRLARSLSNPLSVSPSPFDLSHPFNRSPFSSSLNDLSKSSKQYYLVSKNFTTPPNIIPLIYDRQVLLECLYTNDSTAYGTVRVHNIAYEKRVFVRLTYNDWQSSQDVCGYHSMNYKNNNTDSFTFEIRLKKYDNITEVPKQIYFAVCLQAMNKEFWDNNRGWNYVLDIVERR